MESGAKINVMKRLTLPLAVSLALLLAYILVELFRPDLLAGEWSRYALATVLLVLSIAVVRAVSFFLFDVYFLRRKGRQAPALLRGLLSTTLYSIVFVLIFTVVLSKEVGFEIIATSTIVSVIIGLALQDTLGNFFAGLSLHVEQPFQILDALKISDKVGKVESVTWRATTLRTNNNSILVYPNSKIAREMIEVYPYNNLNRQVLPFPAPYSIAPETVIRLIREAVRSVPNVAPERTPVVRINGFADSSITYEILYWIRDYMLVPDTDARIREHIWYIFGRNGIDIPFPIRHVMLERVGRASEDGNAGYGPAIEAVDLFEPLTPQEREAVARSAARSVYAPGEAILRRGDQGDSMFIICRGRVEVRLPASNGNLQQVAVLESGNFFGEMALLTGEPRTADVYAVDEVEVLEIRKGVIKELFDENSGLAEALSSKIAERQAKLDQYSVAASDEAEKRMQVQRSVLHRMKRFFGLK
jgi:small-conductance mechanosensitive channel/CRP-like cAMP-binding protein